jgi:hypothetical protein
VKLLSVLFLLFTFETADAEGVTLKAGGKVVVKVENQRFNVNCDAERKYVQVEGLKNKSAEKKINARIKKEMTVGKKLKPSDCPTEGKDEEHLTYSNLAVTTGERNGKLGIYFGVRFPGGSGRYAIWCRAYDLQTGEETDLEKCLYSNAKLAQLIDNKMCDREKQETGKEDCRLVDYDKYIYCLDNKGVSVKALASGGKMISGEALLEEKDLKSLFKPSCKLY